MENKDTFSDDFDSILPAAKEVFEIELAGIKRVRDHLDEGFVKAIKLLLKTKGRVVITGIGKSGLVARKITATLASTGTPSMFLHPVEAMHGDLGMVTKDDIIIALSNSGETQELTDLMPAFKNRGIPVIALTGNRESTLAKSSEAMIDTGVDREACALGLAPTASTTATLAAGDALAVVLLKMRRFNEDDFRKNHPAGTLGDRLRVCVREVMITGADIPLVRPGTAMPELLQEMDLKGLGSVLVLDGEESVIGIVTDGDLRRALINTGDLSEKVVEQVMTKNPKGISPEALAAEALARMEKHLITVLPVVETGGQLVGMVHLHDLLGKGKFRFVV
ncbi:MAG: arabinose-5-phosphate isomerase [delta proteobacterium ML8_D]|jgi:arabinose-5-phosphate isomerase|nr:MAG: arabinose-5-phosphate isomerase [delta proteobacterium ML8_D]